MMAQDVEVAPSFQPLLGLAANFLGSHESQVADPMIEAFCAATNSDKLSDAFLRLWKNKGSVAKSLFREFRRL